MSRPPAFEVKPVLRLLTLLALALTSEGRDGRIAAHTIKRLSLSDYVNIKKTFLSDTERVNTATMSKGCPIRQLMKHETETKNVQF